MNIGKIVYDNYDRTVDMYNPPHVYALMHEPNCIFYMASLGNGAIVTIKRKKFKITQYAQIHAQRIVESVFVPENNLIISGSNDLTLGISLFDIKSGGIELKEKIEISEPPNSLMFDKNHNAIYLADTSKDIKLITIKY